MVTATIDTISGNPANFVNEGNEKLLGKLAKRGRIFRVNDAERVEHPVMYGSDGESWTTYAADEYDGAPSTNNLGVAQNEVLTKARFTLLDRTKNFNVPQELIGRPTALAKSEIGYLGQRLAMETYQLEEAYLLRGASTVGGAYDELAPFSGDTDWQATKGTMSLLGLYGIGKDTNTDTFAGIAVNDDAEWDAKLYTASTAAATDLEEFLMDVQEALIRTSFGGNENVTDVLSTIDWYMKFLEALSAKGRIQNTLIKDMGAAPDTEVPFGSVMVDYSRHLSKDALWDLGAGTTSCHPVLGLNLNSLRWNLTGQPSSVGPDAGWIQQISDMQPHPVNTTFFKRLKYRNCFSLDAGRRSFFQIEGWTF